MRALNSGAALEKFRENIEAQHGDPRVCDDPAGFLPLVDRSLKVESPRSGYVVKIRTAEVGHAIAAIGGGRVRIEDSIDPTVGFVAETRIGDKISEGEPLGIVFSGNDTKLREAALRIQTAYEIGDGLPEIPKLVKEVINE